MFEQLRKNIFTFDTTKAIGSTIGIVLPVYLGIHFQEFAIGFCVAMGTLFTFLPNTDGTLKHRTFGMVYGLILSLIISGLMFVGFKLNNTIFLILFSICIFAVSIISVYGFRASMVSLSGLMAVVMAFAARKYNLELIPLLSLITVGGLWYLILSSFLHFIFYRRTTAASLADCIELTADYLRIRENLNWHNSKDETELRKELLKTEVSLNEKHELLRELLLSKRRNEGQSNKTNRFLLIFLELLDIYELAVANNFEIQEIEETLGEYFQKTDSFRKINQANISDLYKLGESLRLGKSFYKEENNWLILQNAEKEIKSYVEIVGLPEARAGAIILRNLQDYELKQMEKIESALRVYSNYQSGNKFSENSETLTQFIPTQDYNWKVILENLSMKSTVFKHSLRISLAMLVGIYAGEWMPHQNSYWILLTIVVILRPNYSLTKSRAINRIWGTLIGAIIGVAIIWVFKNHLIYGVVSIISILFGFAYVQKSYRIAATFITLAVIQLYAILIENPEELIKYRILDTATGALISFFAVYLLWPAWEFGNIKTTIAEANDSLVQYLKQIDRIYHTKETVDSTYRLSRKKAFIDVSNLSAAFQRLTEEPKSQKEHLSQVYASVTLIQTQLSALAALGTFMQSHQTTPASEEYDVLIQNIVRNLEIISTFLETGTMEAEDHESEIISAMEKLEFKYNQLEEIRNKQLSEGAYRPMDLVLRTQLQEGKLITEQLKWLYNLSENQKQIIQHI